MLRRIIFSLICFLATAGLKAQLEGDYTRVQQSLPPSPTAASLGTYGNYTLSNFTGVPDINIPLIDIQLKKFHLPISLSYQAGGIKVEDIGSWVGTGWSLNTGGAVTRTVVDRPDDFNYGVAPGTGILWHNWYMPGYNPSGNGYGYYLDPYGGTTPPNMYAQLTHLRAEMAADTEPDIFFYDLNGVSGKFFFDLGNTPDKSRLVLAPYRDIDVNYTFVGNNNPNFNGDAFLNSFEITDESGNKFYFTAIETNTSFEDGGADRCEFCNSDDGPDSWDVLIGGSYHGNVSYNSAWYLTKIVTASNDEIDYTYTNETINYSLTPSQTVRVKDAAYNLTDAQGCAMTTANMDNAATVTEVSVTTPRLTNISGPNFLVEFDANQNRQDVTGAQALTSVKLFSGNPGNYTLVKQYNLSYHYLADLTKPQIPASWTGDSRQHLMLDNVALVDQGGNTLSSYQLQYNESVPLPDRLSAYKDFWGYFCNYGCATPFPKIYIYPDFYFNPDVDNTYYPRFSVFPMNNYSGTTLVLPGANRNTDPVGILAGTLNKITFPTGGSTTFTFEPHTFNYNGAVITGGGLRLKQTVSFDGINHANDIVKNYSYGNASGGSTSGVLFNLPIFAYTENAARDNSNANGPFSQDNILYYLENLVRCDVSQTTLGGFDGINVGYQQITESQPGNGQIVRTYSTPGYFGQVSDFTNDGGCSIAQSGFCDGYFQAPVPQYYTNYLPCGAPGTPAQPVTLDYNGLDLYTPYTFPFAPCPNYDWNRGKLLTESYLDNAGSLQKSITYQYQLFTPGNTGPRIVKAMKKGRLLNYALMAQSGFSPGCAYTGGTPRYDVIATYTLLGNMTKVPVQQLTTEYDTKGNAFTTTQNFTYSFHSLLPSAIQTDRSDNSSLILNNTYVTDLNLSQSSGNSSYLGYQNLLNDHILYRPVEQYLQKKNTNNSIVTTEGALTTYKAALAVEDVSYLLRTGAPLTNFSPVSVQPTGLTMDARYQAATTFDSYDAGLNLLQYTKVNDLSRSFIWDYKGIYPVAEVRNAAVSDIAYTSFEADGTGSWTVPSTSRPRAAVTGNLSYNLNFSPVSRNNLNPATTYIVSYWSNTGSQVVNNSGPTITGMTVNGWTYYEHVVSGTSSVVLTAGAQDGSIDELRLYPKGALMSSFTYLPMVGKTSGCDANSKITYYQYDGFGRLKIIRDQENNILKSFNYQYKEQQ